MRIIKVSLDGDVDRFGGRALNVQTNQGSFKTPQRGLTSSEFNYKAKLPFEPPLNNDISEIVCQFNGKKWESFMNTNGSFASRLRTIESYSDKMAYTVTRFFPQLPKDIEVNDSEIKQLLELQRMGNLDFISLPNIPHKVRKFEGLVSSFSNEVLSEKREPLPYLDMELEASEFRKRFLTLLELSKSDQIHSIGLIYRPIKNFIQNYMLLWGNRDAKVFLQMSGVSREFTKPVGTSTMHLLQKFGIDSFSSKVGHYFPSKSSKNSTEPTPKSELFHKTKRFDAEPLTYRPFHSWGDGDEPLNCNCPVCQDMNVDDFIDRYNNRSEDYPGQVFNSANRLHEHYQGSDEFEISRKYILTGDLSDYFKSKYGLKKSDIPIKQKTLNGWKK